MMVRLATAADRLSVMRIVNGAMLEVDAEEVERGIDSGDVLVAVEEDRVLGAAVLEPGADGTYIDAIAVRRARRGQGIGGELVAFAAERCGTLTADCDPNVRPFYESLGFDIEERMTDGEGSEEERLRGTLESED